METVQRETGTARECNARQQDMETGTVTLQHRDSEVVRQRDSETALTLSSCRAAGHARLGDEGEGAGVHSAEDRLAEPAVCCPVRALLFLFACFLRRTSSGAT